MKPHRNSDPPRLYNLLTEMARNDLTQNKLAKMTGITQQAISRWINAKSWIGMEKAIKICDTLGISLDYLMQRSDKR